MSICTAVFLSCGAQDIHHPCEVLKSCIDLPMWLVPVCAVVAGIVSKHEPWSHYVVHGPEELKGTATVGFTVPAASSCSAWRQYNKHYNLW